MLAIWNERLAKGLYHKNTPPGSNQQSLECRFKLFYQLSYPAFFILSRLLTLLQPTYTLTVYLHSYSLLTLLQPTYALTVYLHSYSLLTLLQPTYTLTAYLHSYSLLTLLQPTYTLTDYLHSYSLLTLLQSTYSLKINILLVISIDCFTDTVFLIILLLKVTGSAGVGDANMATENGCRV